MNIFGLTISRQKAAPPVPVAENRGGWFRVLESFSGAWQRNVTVDFNTVLSYSAVYACLTLIAGDIAKLRIKLVAKDESGIWSEAESGAFSPVLRKPNRFQNRIQFIENWVMSKLTRGNTYVLKARDNRGVVTALYILDPQRVTTLVSDDGTVFYQLRIDNMAGLTSDITVPASEIIHDRFNCLFHPLVGTSPIFAAGVAATQGNAIQNNSAWFFANKSQPGGMLTAPGAIDQSTADRLKTAWQANYSGENAGKIAVAGDGLTFVPIGMSAEDSQLIEQLKWTAEVVCSVFHVPPYKAGVGEMPKYSNIQALNVEYYSQCLQALIEAMELCLDEGLGLDTPKDGRLLGTELDVDNLLRMDSVTQMDVLDKAKSIMTPDEQRRKLDLKATPGGNVVYRQQQDFSLAALAKRDAQEDPFKSGQADAAKVSQAQADAAAANDNASRAAAAVFLQKGLDDLYRSRKAKR